MRKKKKMASRSKAFEILIERINAKVKRFDFGETETFRLLTRIALRLENQTKVNIRRQGLVDTGNLMNSIKSLVEVRNNNEATISYGSFGVRYAAVHEFGFHGNQAVRAHTRNTRFGAVAVRAHHRQSNIRARPYIRPSLIQQRRFILKLLKEG